MQERETTLHGTQADHEIQKVKTLQLQGPKGTYTPIPSQLKNFES